MPIDYAAVRHPALVINVPSDTDKFWMDGGGVFKAVVRTLPNMIMSTIKEAKLEPNQIRLVIPHQASKPMLNGIAEKLPSLELYHDLEEGNFSSASILKALGKALEQGALRRGDRLVLAGFGAGLFASVVVIQLN